MEYFGFLVSTDYGVKDLIMLIVIFILILVVAFYTSKIIGKSGLNLQKNKNIKVLEVYRLNQTKYIYLIKVGDKTMAVGVTKDRMEYLTEINENSLEFITPGEQSDTSFKDILKQAKNNLVVPKEKKKSKEEK